jgi:hypothetical protein
MLYGIIATTFAMILLFAFAAMSPTPLLAAGMGPGGFSSSALAGSSAGMPLGQGAPRAATPARPHIAHSRPARHRRSP